MIAIWKMTGAFTVAITPHLTILGAVLFFLTWRRRPFAIRETTEVTVTDTDLCVGDQKIPRDSIKRAELLPTNTAHPIVRIALSGRVDEDVVVRDDDAAHELLTAIGFDPSQTTATYRTASLAPVRYRYAPFLFIPLALVLGILSAALKTNLLGLIAPLMIFFMLPIFVYPAKIVVGVDGVLVHWLWIRKFIPTKDIVYVGRFDRGSGRNRVRGIAMTYGDGEVIELPAMDDEQIAVVIKRINDVIALSKGTQHVEDAAMVLSRGALEVRDWITQLKALGAGATATLRTAPVMPDRLWRVAEDAAQPATVRAAAAVALGPTLDQSGKTRLAEIARATAAPKLRVALERAATDAPEEEIEEALRELDAS